MLPAALRQKCGIIPELSVSNTYLDHHYYIEFNPATGDVYAVFYTDAKDGFSAQDILDLPEDGRTKAYRRDSFANAVYNFIPFTDEEMEEEGKKIY